MHQSKSVLIVDDDRTIVSFLGEVLEDEGYTVRRAYDGLTALQEAEITQPDLVLSDIAMPGLDGVTLAGHLRDRGIPVVLLSAAVADPRIPDVPFVPKPFNLDDVLEVATRVLGTPIRPSTISG